MWPFYQSTNNMNIVSDRARVFDTRDWGECAGLGEECQ